MPMRRASLAPNNNLRWGSRLRARPVSFKAAACPSVRPLPALAARHPANPRPLSGTFAHLPGAFSPRMKFFLLRQDELRLEPNKFCQDVAMLTFRRMGELEPWIDENFVRSVWYGMGEQVNVKMIRDKFSG